MTRRQRNNIIIASLCAVVVLMGIGYAAFSSQLKISGTSNITSNFLVKITNIEVSNVVGGADDKEDVTTYTDTTATFGTTLQSPGDSITYDITIENQGTIDAVLKTISKTDTSNSAIIFETSGVFEGDLLNAGELATMQVTVTYNPSVTNQPEDLESNLKVDLGYEQAPEGYVPPVRPITPEDLKDLAVTEGDGLYQDEYEDGKYTYKGANPNNYITFNNETWRIISIDDDGIIKIMRSESIGNRVWDSSSSNNWARPATLNTYLNEEYLPTLSDSDKVVSHNFSIGAVTWDNNDLADQIADENGTTWNGNVGLITLSEYLRANTNTEQCGTFSLNNDNIETCLATDWMYSAVPSGGYMWTISPYDITLFNVFRVFGRNTPGFVSSYRVSNASGVVPVLYLSSDITLNGTGTSGSPYVIS